MKAPYGKIAKKTGLWLCLLLISALAFDRILYRALFPLYDRRSTLSGMNDELDGFIIGSSQTRWAVDGGVISQRTKSRFAVFAPPGANLELRSAMLRDYVERFSDHPPSYIVMEGHPFSFHPTRYPDDAYKTLLGYRPRGILRDYLSQRYGDDPLFQGTKVFHSLSLNSEFYFLASAVVDLPIRTIRPVSELPQDPDLPMETRIAQWRAYYAELKDRGAVDPRFVSAYEDLMRVISRTGIPIIVLDLPIYRLDPQMEKDLSEGRRILQKDLPPNVHYVRFEADRVENDPTYFYDASHLNSKGRVWLSEKLAEEITRTLALSKNK